MTSSPKVAQQWALGHGMTAADLEQLQHLQLAPVPAQPPSRAREFTLARTSDWSDEQLETEVMACAIANDGPGLEALDRLMTAREAVAQLTQAQHTASTDHTVQAWSTREAEPVWATSTSTMLNPGRRAPERLSPDQQARADYETYVDCQWLQAESECNGQLLAPAARGAGVDSRSLFSGPITRAMKHASEELQSWWGAHGRLTYAAFRHQALGRNCDAAAAERVRMETFDNALTW